MFYSKKLKEFSNLKHCFFSRKNGFSSGLYKELNCGLGSNDDRINVLTRPKELEYFLLNQDFNQTSTFKIKTVI